MILSLIVLTASVLAVLMIVVLVRRQGFRTTNLDDLPKQLQLIDVNAFRNLIDEDETQYLRDNLTGRDFRAIHRERMIAATEYVWCAARNAGILIQLAERARQDLDPAVVAAAYTLQESGLRVRLNALQMLPRLYASALVPAVNISPRHGLPEAYDRITRQAIILGCLQSPSRQAAAVP